MTDKAVRKSGEFFESGFYCAESVLLAIAEEKAIQSDLLPRIATGFCSGMARTCGLCGAVSGAILGLNLLTGRDTPDGSLEEDYALVQKLVKLFKGEFGSINCQELTGCDLATEEGQTRFRETDQGKQCKRYVEEATRMATALIEGKP